MPTAPAPLFDRPDTMFGVCEGVGQDFGFNPNILRVTLGVGLLWNPMIVAAVYVTLGVAVVLSRLLSPTPKVAPAPIAGPIVEQLEERYEIPMAKAA